MTATSENEIYPYGERRLSLRLLRYWQEKKGLRAMPIENDIDPEELGIDWEYCFLLQARDVTNVQDYNFTYLGKKIMNAYFDKAIDEHNQFMVGPNAFRLSKHFTRVIDSKAPVLDEGEFETLHGRRVLYRQVLLPLGELEQEANDDLVGAIFGAMNYKIADA